MQRYEVFARRDHDAEMQRLGTVNAGSVDAAKGIAWYGFDGFAVVELWLVPTDGIVSVERPPDAMEDRVLQQILQRGSQRVSTVTGAGEPPAAQQPRAAGETDPGVRDLVLALIDTKLVLGYHYRQRAPRSPSFDDANALQGMSAGEFGQAYHLMDTLERFGDSPQALERRRSPEEYSSMDVLDGELDDWESFLAATTLADLATLIRLESCADGAGDSVAALAGKAAQEEEFHVRYLSGACASYAAWDPARGERLRERMEELLPATLRWFGRDGDASESSVGQAPSEERALLLQRVDELLSRATRGQRRPMREPQLDFSDWDDRRQRSVHGEPPAHAVSVLALKDMDGSIRWDRGTERMV